MISKHSTKQYTDTAQLLYKGINIIIQFKFISIQDYLRAETTAGWPITGTNRSD